MDRRRLGPDHPEVVTATVALGKVLEERGGYTEAIALFESAVQSYSTAGTPPADLADSLMHLANVHYYAGNLDTSELLNRRLLPMHRQVHGESHPLVADTLINLATIQFNRGHYDRSEELNRQALALVRPWYDDDHPEMASSMTILAQALVMQKKFDEAVPLLRGALAIQERTYGSVHPRVALVLNELGSVALQQTRLDEAEASFARVVSIYREVYGGHYRLGVALSNLASVHHAANQFERAEQLLREALALYADTLPADHMNTAVARIKLGRALLRQQRLPDAEEQLLGGYGALRSQASPSVSWLQAARRDLAALYRETGRLDEARRFDAEADAVVAQAGG
jgi:serine/threonine-protein kinase